MTRRASRAARTMRGGALGAAALLLAGCGVAGTGFQPGAAAQVNATDQIGRAHV